MNNSKRTWKRGSRGSIAVATVELSRSRGFAVTSEPNRELLELEPQDIHMTMELYSGPGQNSATPEAASQG